MGVQKAGKNQHEKLASSRCSFSEGNGTRKYRAFAGSVSLSIAEKETEPDQDYGTECSVPGGGFRRFKGLQSKARMYVEDCTKVRFCKQSHMTTFRNNAFEGKRGKRCRWNLYDCSPGGDPLRVE